MAEPILIWGAGAIGGTLGATWARAGVDVLLVDMVAEHVEACRAGLAIVAHCLVDSGGDGNGAHRRDGLQSDCGSKN